MSTPTLYVVCVLIWGTTWFAITSQLAVLAPEVGVAIRFALASAAILGWCAWRRLPLRLPPRVHGLAGLQGVCGFCLSYIAIYHAERHVVSGVVAIGYAASPLLGLVAARVFLGTPMSRRVAFGGLAGLAGVALIFGGEFGRLGDPREVALGAALTAAAVLLSTTSTIAAQRYHRLGVSGWPPLAWAMAYGAVGAAVAAVLAGRPWGWSWSPEFLGSLAYLSLAGSVVTFGAFYAIVRRLGTARAGYVGVMTPVVALAVSAALEGYAWTSATVGGIALAIAGNVLALGRGSPPAAAGEPQADSSTSTGA